jgi:hypothetical protein
MLASCAPDEVTWYQLTSVNGQPLPIRDYPYKDGEFLGSSLEVWNDSTAVSRIWARQFTEDGSGEVETLAGRVSFVVTENPNGPDSVTFGSGANKDVGTLSDGVLSLSQDGMVFREWRRGHPEIRWVFDLISLNGKPLPTELSQGLAESGRFQWYSDGTFVLTWKGEAPGIWFNREPYGAIAGEVETVRGAVDETVLLLSFHSYSEVDPEPGALSGDILTVEYRGDTWVFEKRR